MVAVLALLAAAVALAVVAVVWRTPPAPRLAAATTATSRSHAAAARPVARPMKETVVVVIVTPTREATALPNCEVTLFQGSVCTWPLPTVVLPLPTCGPREAGLTCIRLGPVQATIPLPTATPTFALGVVVKEGRER